MRSVPACAVYLHTNERFCLHMLRVFFNAVAKKLGDTLFKSRSVPILSALLLLNLLNNLKMFKLHSAPRLEQAREA